MLDAGEVSSKHADLHKKSDKCHENPGHVLIYRPQIWSLIVQRPNQKLEQVR